MAIARSFNMLHRVVLLLSNDHVTSLGLAHVCVCVHDSRGLQHILRVCIPAVRVRMCNTTCGLLDHFHFMSLQPARLLDHFHFMSLQPARYFDAMADSR